MTPIKETRILIREAVKNLKTSKEEIVRMNHQRALKTMRVVIGGRTLDLITKAVGKIVTLIMLIRIVVRHVNIETITVTTHLRIAGSEIIMTKR